MRKEEQAYLKGYRVTEQGVAVGPSGVDLIGWIDENGYKRISFRVNKIHKWFHVHRLQAYQKYGKGLFESKLVCRHIDGNTLNNSYENIVLGTQSENMQDIPSSIRISKAIYAASFIKKHDHDSVYSFYMDNGMSYKTTMEKFNISSKGTLHFILNKHNGH